MRVNAHVNAPWARPRAFGAGLVFGASLVSAVTLAIGLSLVAPSRAAETQVTILTATSSGAMYLLGTALSSVPTPKPCAALTDARSTRRSHIRRSITSARRRSSGEKATPRTVGRTLRALKQTSA